MPLAVPVELPSVFYTVLRCLPCCRFPVSGGAFSYIMVRWHAGHGVASCTSSSIQPAWPAPSRLAASPERPAPAPHICPWQVTFGEFPAFVTLASLLLEYALGMAATARGFSLYLNSLLNLSPGTLIININDGAHTLDPLVGLGVGKEGGERNAHCDAAAAGSRARSRWLGGQGTAYKSFRLLRSTRWPDPAVCPQAAAIVLLMSVLLSLGVRESAWFISGGQLGGWAWGCDRGRPVAHVRMRRAQPTSGKPWDANWLGLAC